MYSRSHLCYTDPRTSKVLSMFGTCNKSKASRILRLHVKEDLTPPRSSSFVDCVYSLISLAYLYRLENPSKSVFHPHDHACQRSGFTAISTCSTNPPIEASHSIITLMAQHISVLQYVIDGRRRFSNVKNRSTKYDQCCKYEAMHAVSCLYATKALRHKELQSHPRDVQTCIRSSID